MKKTVNLFGSLSTTPSNTSGWPYAQLSGMKSQCSNSWATKRQASALPILKQNQRFFDIALQD
ncbi:hypothetical protein [Kiloniella majae]|uniref:hypothetical protein n=1 Tax=Kiloniella majae TaxID=1938558 RepID=UPI000A27701F|nr:hypothetical protein [Kiloniella majae]